MKDNRVYLEHIVRCISRIEEYTAKGREVFFSSSMAQDATLRNLQTMAESTQRLGDNIKAQYPDIDWRALSGFRNVLVHDYLGIDLEFVYQATQEHMPDLKVAVTALLRDLSEDT